MPWLAFGTGTVLYAKNCTALASRALDLGFTHLDTAQSYQNEESLGDAVDSFVASGGDSRVRKERREGLYITTKLEKIPEGESVEDKLRASLRKLRVDYVNLFLVHNPLQHVAREGGLKGVWKEMVEVKRKGLAHSIGVSNFNRAQLEEIVSLGLDVPAINQVKLTYTLFIYLLKLVDTTHVCCFCKDRIPPACCKNSRTVNSLPSHARYCHSLVRRPHAHHPGPATRDCC